MIDLLTDIKNLFETIQKEGVVSDELLKDIKNALSSIKLPVTQINRDCNLVTADKEIQLANLISSLGLVKSILYEM